VDRAEIADEGSEADREAQRVMILRKEKLFWPNRSVFEQIVPIAGNLLHFGNPGHRFVVTPADGGADDGDEGALDRRQS
jgi:hypothetical protein